jgi:hypothetical protein
MFCVRQTCTFGVRYALCVQEKGSSFRCKLMRESKFGLGISASQALMFFLADVSVTYCIIYTCIKRASDLVGL